MTRGQTKNFFCKACAVHGERPGAVPGSRSPRRVSGGCPSHWLEWVRGCWGRVMATSSKNGGPRRTRETTGGGPGPTEALALAQKTHKKARGERGTSGQHGASEGRGPARSGKSRHRPKAKKTVEEEEEEEEERAEKGLERGVKLAMNENAAAGEHFSQEDHIRKMERKRKKGKKRRKLRLSTSHELDATSTPSMSKRKRPNEGAIDETSETKQIKMERSDEDEDSFEAQYSRWLAAVPYLEDRTSAPSEYPLGSKDPSRQLCGVPKCNGTARFKGLCRIHGGREPCSVPGCKRSAKAYGKCKEHKFRWCAVKKCDQGAEENGVCKEHQGIKVTKAMIALANFPGRRTCCVHKCERPNRPGFLKCQRHLILFKCSFDTCMRTAIYRKLYCADHEHLNSRRSECVDKASRDFLASIGKKIEKFDADLAATDRPCAFPHCTAYARSGFSKCREHLVLFTCLAPSCPRLGVHAGDHCIQHLDNSGSLQANEQFQCSKNGCTNPVRRARAKYCVCHRETCVVTDCDRNANFNGLCSTHGVECIEATCKKRAVIEGRCSICHSVKVFLNAESRTGTYHENMRKIAPTFLYRL